MPDTNIQETELTKFDYTTSQLMEIVAETSGIIKVDIDNKEELETVKKGKLALGKIRNALKEFGLDKRSYFNKISKKIKEKEDELVAIVQTEEDRLAVFLEEAKAKKELVDRLLLLPMRRDQVSRIEDGIEVTDEFILSLNAEQFSDFIITKKTDYLNLKEAKLREAEVKINYEKQVREREDKARLEAEERLKKEIELSKQKAELDKQEALRKAEAEKQAIIDENNRKERNRIKAEEQKKADEEEKMRIEKENQEKLERAKKYQNWLKKNGWTEETKTDFLIEKAGDKIRLAKIIGFYDIK